MIRPAPLAAGFAALLAACDPTTVEVVGPAGSVYQPGKGCRLSAESAACPTPLDVSFGFEGEDATTVSNMTPATLRDVAPSCARSFCGVGALRAHARYTWTGSAESGGDASRLGGVRFELQQPVDLLGKRISARLAAAQLAPRALAGVDTGVQALIGILTDAGTWHRVVIARLPEKEEGWLTFGGVVAPDDVRPALPSGTKAVVVTEIWLQTYLELPVTNGDVFEADFYFDEIGWQAQ